MSDPFLLSLIVVTTTTHVFYFKNAALQIVCPAIGNNLSIYIWPAKLKVILANQNAKLDKKYSYILALQKILQIAACLQYRLL